MKNSNNFSFPMLISAILLTTILAAGILPITADAQVIQDWVQIYNGTGNNSDRVNAMIVDGAGNVYVTGYSTGAGTGYDITTIKYNPAGIQQWIQIFNGSANQNDAGISIATDASGNIYVTGYSAETGSGHNFRTIKYNADGIQLWTQSYNGPGNGSDLGTTVKADASGNVYVSGMSLGTGTNYDYVTIKYDMYGTQLWAARYNGTGNNSDYPVSVCVDLAGNVIVYGTSTGSGTDKDYAVVKYDEYGTQLWVQRYDGNANGVDEAMNMAIDAAGNIYVTGGVTQTGSGSDYATIKYNPSGVMQWIQFKNGSGNGADMANSIELDAYGNVYITGKCIGSTSGSDYGTVKYDNSGTEIWANFYNGPANNTDEATKLALDIKGNVYVTGFTTGIGTATDITTIKYTSAGTEEWNRTYASTGYYTDAAYALGISSTGFVYVAGRCYSPVSFDDFLTVKYLQAPFPPALVSPVNNAANVSLTPELIWEAMPTALNFRLQVSADAGFTTPLIDLSTLTGNTYTLSEGILNFNTTYYWRVKGYNTAGWGDYSETRNFTTRLSASQKIQSIIATVDSMVTAGIINKGNGNSLKVKLEQALKKYTSGDFKTAVNMLNAFINEVEAFIRSGKLTMAQGQGLIDRTLDVISELLGDNPAAENEGTKSYKLGQNFPNPFNPVTSISFEIPKSSLTKLIIYDMLGREITRLVDNVLTEGKYTYNWNASQYASGVYFYRLESGNFTQIKRMLLIK